ncbi:CoA transferase, partial [Phenylobacterium sp.]|uniref:CaiB/BaiF CoA transferase family protein n=1 Tax=Phenylobacterium sp. TaxID=1871053 RepID=UPI0025DB0ADB
MRTATALDGLLVLDLTTFLSGPYCTMMLGDMGAEVIKVERPDGDEARRMPPFVEGRSQPFALWNRNKRSIALDLKAANDTALLWKLVAKADVLVENFRPGALERAGFGWDALHRANPRLVVASISGFGQSGPWAQHGGFDMMAQGMSGLMAGNGPPDGEPYRLPIAITDLAAGMFTTSAILAALMARTKTGVGQRIDQSLFEAGLSLGVYEAAHVFTFGTEPERMGQLHRGNSPYRVFRTRDGWITIGANKDAFWRRLCEMLGRPDLPEDARFRTNADRVANNASLVPLLQAALERQDSAHWLAELGKAGIPAEPVLTFDAAIAHPQAAARNM